MHTRPPTPPTTAYLGGGGFERSVLAEEAQARLAHFGNRGLGPGRRRMLLLLPLPPSRGWTISKEQRPEGGEGGGVARPHAKDRLWGATLGFIGSSSSLGSGGPGPGPGPGPGVGGGGGGGPSGTPGPKGDDGLALGEHNRPHRNGLSRFEEALRVSRTR